MNNTHHQTANTLVRGIQKRVNEDNYTNRHKQKTHTHTHKFSLPFSHNEKRESKIELVFFK